MGGCNAAEARQLLTFLDGLRRICGRLRRFLGASKGDCGWFVGDLVVNLWLFAGNTWCFCGSLFAWFACVFDPSPGGGGYGLFRISDLRDLSSVSSSYYGGYWVNSSWERGYGVGGHFFLLRRCVRGSRESNDGGSSASVGMTGFWERREMGGERFNLPHVIAVRLRCDIGTPGLLCRFESVTIPNVKDRTPSCSFLERRFQGAFSA